MGPTEIFLGRVLLSICLDSSKVLFFPFDLSTALRRELVVVADDTGCRGRELLRGGDSLGGGVVMYAWSRVLLFGVKSPGGAPLRPDPGCVGVLALEMVVFEFVVGVVALDVLPLACGLFVLDGELERVDDVLEEPLGLLSFLTDSGSLEAVDDTLCDDAGFRDIGLRFTR